jgi:Flp pilus assembly protein TadD
LLESLLILWLFTEPTLLQRGLVALQHGQLTQARATFEEAAHADPHNPYVWASLAETYLRLKEPDKAAIAAQTAERGVAANPLVAHALAMYYSEAGDAAHAARLEEQYRAAAWDKTKNDPRTAFQYVQILLEREEFSKAADVIATALQVHPTDPQLILALGVARYGQRRFEDAVTAFLKVVQIDPGIQQPYVFLGKMLDQAGDHLGEITKAYQAWAAADPKNATAQLLLARALLVQDSRSARAEMLLRQSIALDPKNWESHYELGVLLAGKRDYKDAELELTRSTELNPKEPMPHYHLARVYDRLGEPDKAAAERQIHQRLTQRPAAPKTQ